MLKLLPASMGSLLIKALIAVLVVGYIYVIQEQNSAYAETVERQTLNITKLKSVNEAESAANRELRDQIREHERIALERIRKAETIRSSTVDIKQQLDTTIKESNDEQDIAWADELVPDVVVSVLIDSTGSSYSDTTYKNYTASSTIPANRNANIQRANEPRSG